MARLEDDDIAAERKKRHVNCIRGAELLERRAHSLILEAHELRKLAARLEEISSAELRDVGAS
jgi:hypothetical protein